MVTPNRGSGVLVLPCEWLRRFVGRNAISAALLDHTTEGGGKVITTLAPNHELNAPEESTIVYDNEDIGLPGE